MVMESKWWLRNGGVTQEEWIIKEGKEAVGGDGYIHHVDGDDAFTDVIHMSNRSNLSLENV